MNLHVIRSSLCKISLLMSLKERNRTSTITISSAEISSICWTQMTWYLRSPRRGSRWLRALPMRTSSNIKPGRKSTVSLGIQCWDAFETIWSESSNTMKRLRTCGKHSGRTLEWPLSCACVPLITKFDNYKRDLQPSMNKHLCVMAAIIKDLRAAGHTMNDEKEIQGALASLPSARFLLIERLQT